jgi:hypothetical protein
MARFWMLLAAFAAFSTVLAAPATTLKNTACPILFDGRVGLTAKPADFDKNTSVYNHQYDLGQSELFVDTPRNGTHSSSQT